MHYLIMYVRKTTKNEKTFWEIFFLGVVPLTLNFPLNIIFLWVFHILRKITLFSDISKKVYEKNLAKKLVTAPFLLHKIDYKLPLVAKFSGQTTITLQNKIAQCSVGPDMQL